jgi:hypothetical protein
LSVMLSCGATGRRLMLLRRLLSRSVMMKSFQISNVYVCFDASEWTASTVPSQHL